MNLFASARKADDKSIHHRHSCRVVFRLFVVSWLVLSVVSLCTAFEMSIAIFIPKIGSVQNIHKKM